jgi:RNA polymerase sigma-70 factor (ECF subfamily)
LEADFSEMTQDHLYERATADFGPALERLARSYEADPDKRGDLLQEIHLATWRSFAGFRGQCSLRTWVYRVAHNVAASHVLKDRRAKLRTFVSLDEIDDLPGPGDPSTLDQRRSIEQMYALIQQLQPLDREVILLYLEGMDGASIGEVTGLSPSNAATKIHRIKNILASRFRHGGRDGR